MPIFRLPLKSLLNELIFGTWAKCVLTRSFASVCSLQYKVKHAVTVRGGIIFWEKLLTAKVVPRCIVVIGIQFPKSKRPLHAPARHHHFTTFRERVILLVSGGFCGLARAIWFVWWQGHLLLISSSSSLTSLSITTRWSLFTIALAIGGTIHENYRLRIWNKVYFYEKVLAKTV